MAKRKAAHRNRVQGGSRHATNQISSGSAQNTPVAQVQESNSPPTQEAVTAMVVTPRATFEDGAPQDASAIVAPVSEPDPEYLAGFQVVSRRPRPARVVCDREPGDRTQPVAFQYDMPSYTTPRHSFLDRRRQAYVAYLSRRLNEAIIDETLDFGGILAELYRLLGSDETRSTGTESDQYDFSEQENEDVDDLGVWDAEDAPPVPDANRSFEISLDDNEHFPALGAPSRPGRSEPSGSGSRRPTSSAPSTPIETDRVVTPCDPVPVSPSAPSLSELRQLAENASVLLELYSQTTPDSDPDSSHQLITSAFASVSKIHRYHNVLAAAQPGTSTAAQKRVENTDMTINAGCVICYSEIADTLLVPCHHLVLCGLCCDMMGIGQQTSIWDRKIPCPMCRTKVLGRIKTFRC